MKAGDLVIVNDPLCYKDDVGKIGRVVNITESNCFYIEVQDSSYGGESLYYKAELTLANQQIFQNLIKELYGD